MWAYYCNNSTPNQKSLDQIGDASPRGVAGTIIIAESYNVWLWDWGNPLGCSLFDRLRVPHSEGLNAIFCDSHAKWRKAVSLKTTDFGAPEPGVSYSTDSSKIGCS